MSLVYPATLAFGAPAAAMSKRQGWVCIPHPLANDLPAGSATDKAPGECVSAASFKSQSNDQLLGNLKRLDGRFLPIGMPLIVFVIDFAQDHP
jgi:hypothetical protein